jgi:hypothetical protein
VWIIFCSPHSTAPTTALPLVAILLLSSTHRPGIKTHHVHTHTNELIFNQMIAGKYLIYETTMDVLHVMKGLLTHVLAISTLPGMYVM